MPRTWIVLAAALAVVGFGTAPPAGGDASKGPLRRTRPEVTDLRIGDGGVVVTSEDSPNVEVRFRLTSKRRANVRVRFEWGDDRNGNGHVDDDEFESEGFDFLAPGGTSETPRRRQFASVARFRATPEGVEHVAVWRARGSLFGSRLLAVSLEPARSRPDAFDLVPATRPVLRVTAARAEPVLRAFEYDGDAAPSLTFDEVQPTPSPRLVGTAFDADSEDLNGNNRLDPLEAEDRNGDGLLGTEPVEVFAWWVRVPEGFDPSALTPDELLRLDWRPCTLDLDLGPAIQYWNVATPNGHYVSFLWNANVDVPGELGPFLLGMRVHDGALAMSGFEVFAQPVTVGP